MTVDETFAWVEKLTAFSAVLQTFEMLAIRKAWSDQGLWRWSRLRSEFGRTANVLGHFLNEQNFARLLQFRIVACAVILVFPTGFPLLSLPVFYLLFSTYMIALRWRGAFNGGSDAMMIVLLAALSIGNLAPSLKYYCLVGVAVQVSLSFVLAGIAKLRVSEWRSARALPALLQSSNFGVPVWARHLVSGHSMVSWSILIFECTFPLAFFNPVLARLYLATALVFHIVNFFVFGLNRFFFTWVSAYPVLFLFSSR